MDTELIAQLAGAGVALGIIEGIKPGPLLTMVIRESLSKGLKAGMWTAAAPIFTDGPLIIEAPEERRLALELLKFPQTVKDAAHQLEPSRLCRYLYGLAGEFSSFYQACPVLKAEDQATRESRLHLSALVRDILHDGLDQLGIEAPTRM